MNNVIITINGFSIYWYSVIMLVAILVGGFIAIREAKKFDIPKEYMTNLFFYMIPIAYIGARIYYVLFNLDYYRQNMSEIYKIWEGGLAIHGGIILGLLWLIIYAKKYKIKPILMTDIVCVGLIIAQAIGRWGNFMNQEAHGGEVSLEFLQKLNLPEFIINGMHIDGVYYHPTFLYESVLCFIGFIFLIIIRRRRHIKLGQTTSLYLMWYGAVRFYVESLRTDSLMFSEFRIAQVVSVVMFVSGFIMFFVMGRGSKLENLYNDRELIQNVKF